MQPIALGAGRGGAGTAQIVVGARGTLRGCNWERDFAWLVAYSTNSPHAC